MSNEAAHLTPAQVAELVDAVGSTRYAPFFGLLVDTGFAATKHSRSGGPRSTSTEGCCESGAPWRAIDGALVITQPKTAKSMRFVTISAPAAHLLQDVRASQAAERLRAGSAWHETGYVFTTETRDPCDLHACELILVRLLALVTA